MRLLARLLIVAAMQSVGCNDPAVHVTDASKEITKTSETSSAQTSERNVANPETGGSTNSIASKPIGSGSPLKTALTSLDNAGYTKETMWQWASFDPDAQYICRVITDGIYIVLYYSDKTQLLTGVAMMYVPPEYTQRGNYRVVDVDSVAFNTNGAYTVVFPKPKPSAGK